MSLQKAVYGFVPTSITGCALWLDGADSSTITGTSPVTQWRDKSVNNYSMTYTGSPTYRTTAALNNLGCVTFNGTTSFNSGTDTMYWSAFSLSQPFTVFVVCTKRLSSNANFSFVLEPSISSGSVILYGGLQLKMYAGSADQYTNPILTFVANSTYIYSAVFNGASSLLAYAGNATSSLNPGTASWPGLYLGRDWGGTYDSGDYGEIIFYSGALSTNQRQQVEGYLAQKWGLTSSLPSSHPGRTTTFYRSDYTKQNVMTARPYYVAFSPRQISGCALWLDGADPAGNGVLPANGATVSTWVDKSGNANNGTSGSATFQTDSAGGYINFTGSQTYSITNPNVVVNQYFTIFVVEQLQNYGGGEAAFMGGSGSLNANLHMRYYNNGSNIKFGFFNNDLDTTVTGFTTNSSQPNRIWSFSFLSSSRVIYLNGTSVGSDTNNTQLSGWAGATIGAMVSYGGQYYTGKMREVMIFSGSLLTAQRQQIESYLAQKWGLTASLPGGHSHATQPAGAITLQSLANKQIVRRRVVYTINWTYTIPSQANLILQVNSRNWTSSASILDSITGVAWNLTNASLNSSRNTILMSGNGLFKYNNAGAGPSGFSGTQHTVMMVYYRLANATSASKGNPPSVTLNLTGYLYTINRTPATITNQLLAGENSSWVYQSAYQVGTNQTVLDGTTGWTFIAFVYTGTALNVYLNGQPENNPNSVSNPATTTLTNNYFSIFGNPRDNNAFINGELAFYGLWNTQLTAQNILDFYNTNKDQFLAFP